MRLFQRGAPSRRRGYRGAPSGRPVRLLLTLAVVLGAVTGVLRSGRALEPETPLPLDETIKRIVARVGPSVVRVQVDGENKDPRPERRFFRDPSIEPRDGGAGVVIRPDGLVLTNASLLAVELPRIEILTGSGRRLVAELIAKDDRLDVALIKADVGKDPLPALELGTASDLVPGRIVLSFGNPFGVARDSRASASLGIVRFVGPLDAREAVYRGDVIFTDAAVNPGNEGGPLVDLDGRVVGLVAPLARDRRAQAMTGYAIPIDAIAPRLDALGKGVSSGKLGVLLAEGDALVVNRVVPKSAADKAGLKEGDKLLELDGAKLDGRDSLRKSLGDKRPGARVVFMLERAGSKMELEVELGGAE